MAGKTFEQIMKETQTAKKVIKNFRIDKNYDNYKNLRLRGVNSTSVIAKTLGVSTRTVSRYGNQWKEELQQKTNNINKNFEVQKILEQIDAIFSQIWNTIITDNMSGKDKISAINNLMAPLKLKTEILGFDKGNFYFENNSINNLEINTEIYEYWNKKIEEYNIDIVELTGIKPI